MASPIEMIRQGIEASDWKKVVQGYNRLSGDKLKVPASGKRQVISRMEVDDIPDYLRNEIEQPLLKAMSEAIRRLQAALNSDDRSDDPDEDEDEDPEEEDEDEDEEEDDPDQPDGEDYDFTPQEEEDEPSPFDPNSQMESENHAEENGHPAGSVEARASAARAMLRGEREIPDFTHVHTGTPQGDEHPELGRKCRTESFKPGTFKNEFIDDRRRFRGDIKVDKKLTKGLRPSRRRPPVRKVKLKCFKCEKTYAVDQALAPRIIKTQDGVQEKTSFVCDNCMKRTVA
jgi:hypothetical protein